MSYCPITNTIHTEVTVGRDVTPTVVGLTVFDEKECFIEIHIGDDMGHAWIKDGPAASFHFLDGVGLLGGREQ